MSRGARLEVRTSMSSSRALVLALVLVALSGCTPAAATPMDAAGGSDAARTDGGTTDDASSMREDAGSPGADTGTAPADTGASGATIPVIVAAGANHWRWLSIDEGVTWCAVPHESTGTTDFDNPYLFRNITFANGRFVAGSWRGIFVSTNGYAWTDVTNGAGPAFGQWVAQIDYGNGWWVATGGYGTAMRSHDLTAWEDTSDSLPGDEASRTLAFGDGRFVTARDSVGWWESTDGTGWTQRDAAGGTEVRFDGASFVARPDYDEGRGIRLQGGWPNHIRRSDDGGASYADVADVDDAVTRFAFGTAPAEDYALGRVPTDLATCLGL